MGLLNGILVKVILQCDNILGYCTLIMRSVPGTACQKEVGVQSQKVTSATKRDEARWDFEVPRSLIQ